MNGLDDHPHDAPKDLGTSLGVDAHLLGMLSYLFSIVSGVLILVLEKRHAKVRFHAAQSVVFSIAAIVLSVVASALMFVPVVGLPVIGPLAVQLAGRA